MASIIPQNAGVGIIPIPQEITVVNISDLKTLGLTPPAQIPMALLITFTSPILPNIEFQLLNISRLTLDWRTYFISALTFGRDVQVMKHLASLHATVNSTQTTVEQLRTLVIKAIQQFSILTNQQLLIDIQHASKTDLLYLLQKCENAEKKHYFLSVSYKPRHQEYVMIAMVGKKKQQQWLEMQVNLYTDRNRNSSTGADNTFQFHMFITRNWQYTIHQWIHNQSTTPNLAIALHCAGKLALKAKHIVSKPIGKMPSIMLSNGFQQIATQQQMEKMIGKHNINHFEQVESGNTWYISTNKTDENCSAFQFTAHNSILKGR